MKISASGWWKMRAVNNLLNAIVCELAFHKILPAEEICVDKNKIRELSEVSRVLEILEFRQGLRFRLRISSSRSRGNRLSMESHFARIRD
jgi:hypothetical protein